MLVFWSLASLVRNSVVLAVYQYIELKVTLSSLGVNLTELDRIGKQ